MDPRMNELNMHQPNLRINHLPDLNRPGLVLGWNQFPDLPGPADVNTYYDLHSSNFANFTEN